MNKKTLVTLVILSVLVLDQALKVYVKLNFTYAEEYQILGLDRVLLHFVENDGMAFGITFGGSYGKLLLSLFRIGAVAFLFVYLAELIRRKTSRGVLLGFAFIQAGALGNIIDSVFYGVLFSESPYYGGGTAEFLPDGGGYAPLLFGRVVDMFYFPLFYGQYPEWIPWLGGEPFLFFKPVFNLADVAISFGVALLLIGQFRDYRRKRMDARRSKISEEE